ncbi:hypothetical protein MRX96_019697 [Rhipicephalus microplus]
MASIPWYLPLLVLLVNTFGAPTTGPLLTKSQDGIKTGAPSAAGGVKGVKGIGVKSITAASDFLKGTVPPSPKNLPDDIDPFALSPVPPSNVNNGTPLSPGNENEVPNVPGGGRGALNPAQSGTGSVTTTTTTNNVLSITNTGSSTTQPTGGSTVTLQPLGPRTTIPGAPGDSSILTSAGLNPNTFVGIYYAEWKAGSANLCTFHHSPGYSRREQCTSLIWDQFQNFKYSFGRYNGSEQFTPWYCFSSSRRSVSWCHRKWPGSRSAWINNGT